MTSTRVALCLTFAFFFYVVGGAKVTFTNRCQYTVWPGTFARDQKPQLSKTGFELGPGLSDSVDLPTEWSGQFWARTGCSSNNGKFSCATADCASGQVTCNGAGAIPPATLIKLTVASNGGQDFYDVSNVDGFNVPMSVKPEGGTGSGECKTASCPANINAVCPNQFKVTSGSDVVACESACVAFKEPQDCCTEAYNTPQTCRPTDYSQFFKQQCPDATSYEYDESSIFTCFGGPNYAITFCP